MQWLSVELGPELIHLFPFQLANKPFSIIPSSYFPRNTLNIMQVFLRPISVSDLE